MKRIIALLTAVILMLLCATPVLAAGLAISPPSVEFDVPAESSAEVEFLVYDFTGDLEISLEDIPLRVEPTTVPVTASAEGSRIVLTFYGDESLGSKIYQGKIRFLAMTGGTVAMGIKVRATITNLVESETPVLATPEESQPPASQEPEEESIPEEEASEETTTEVTSPIPEEQVPTGESEESSSTPEEQAPTGESEEQSSSTPEEQAPTGESEEQSSSTPGSSSFPILPVAGIAAGTIIIITLIVVIARRYRY